MTEKNLKSDNSSIKPGKDVSLRRRLEVLEEDLNALKEVTAPLRREMEKIKDFIGMNN